MMTAAVAVARDAVATAAPMRRATRGGGQRDSSGATVQGGGKPVSKIAAATAKKAKAKISAANKAKAAADAALAADAAAVADATIAADVLELARQSEFTSSAISVASPSSAATKNPGKNLYMLLFIRFNLYHFV